MAGVSDWVGTGASLASKLLPAAAGPVEMALSGAGTALKLAKALAPEAPKGVEPPLPPQIIQQAPPPPINVYNTPTITSTISNAPHNESSASNDRYWRYRNSYAPRSSYRYRKTVYVRKPRKKKATTTKKHKKKN